MRTMTREQVITKLRRRLNGTTQAKVAGDMGISPMALNDVLRGRRPPCPAILSNLGLSRVIRYAPTNGRFCPTNGHSVRPRRA